MKREAELIDDYQQRIEKMSDKQLLSEVRSCCHQTWYNGKPSLRNVVELTPLEIMLEALVENQ